MRSFGLLGIDLQERDLDIFVGLFECRVMTLAHIADLYFEGKGEAAKKRVQKLKRAGFLRERNKRVGDPSVLHIATKAFSVLGESGRLGRFPHIRIKAFEKRGRVSPVTLRHELEVMDVRATFFRAVREQPHLAILEFSTWPKLYEFTAQHDSLEYGRRALLVKPDGFVRIREEKALQGAPEHSFFLEVDRGTESLETIVQKAVCYLSHYRAGGFAETVGGSGEEYKRFPFRVLMIFQTEERRNNVATKLLHHTPPVFTLVWLATKKDVQGAPFGDVWTRPKDVSDGRHAGLF